MLPAESSDLLSYTGLYLSKRGQIIAWENLQGNLDVSYIEWATVRVKTDSEDAGIVLVTQPP